MRIISKSLQPVGDVTPDDAIEGTTTHTPNEDNRPVNDVTGGPDHLIGAEILLPHGDWNEVARAMERKCNSDGLFN